MTGVRLASFELLEQIGSGAMGSVHLGRVVHGPGEGHEVAVKILSARYALHPRFRALFRREVAGVSALDHPRIVSIYDFGEVDGAAEDSSEGTLVTGSPWLAMELVDGGVLGRPGIPWGLLRESLLSLLDALGHAHARNVIHRDIKPGNILMGRDGLKLGDFGLVYSFEEVEHADSADSQRMGTPAYMAPEQFQGRSRDFGPWTDLYAVGCLAYALTSGRPPFGSQKTFEESMMGHLCEEPPPLLALRPVPVGFADWVGRLLQKSPGDRYVRAADAAHALLALGDADEGGFGPNSSEIPEAAEDTGAQTAELMTVVALDADVPSGVVPRQSSRPRAGENDSAHVSVPRNWRRADEGEKPRWIQGLGLRLFGLRPVPFVGREEEREQLWQMLRKVARDDGAVRLAVIRGEAGVGKTRLAEWACERAHELGAAKVLRAVHGVRPGPLKGIRAMVARHLQCVGLSREEVIERVINLDSNDEAVERDEAEAIAELLSPASQEDRESGVRFLHFDRPEEWYGVLERLLHRLAASRPVVLCLDDAQWGLDALGFTLYLLGRHATHPARILILMTLQDEKLNDESIEGMWVTDLQRHERSVVVPLQPLSADEQAKLTRVGLGLVPVLAEQIDRKARGVPLYAIQLVSQWAEEGRLVGGGRGFRFREDAGRDLPETLAAVWTDRVTTFLAQRTEADGIVLELASALGEDGVETELQEVCRRNGVSISEDLIDALLAHRLARRFGDDGEWLFGSGMIHEVLEARARDGGRWQEHHRSCAEVLGATPHMEERRARHLVLAGREEEALEPLLTAAQIRHRCGEIIVARRLLDRFHEAAAACQLPESDRRWGRALFSEAIVARGFADFDRSMEKVLRLEQLASAHGWDELLGAAKLSRANHHQDHFEVDAARLLYREALALFGGEGSMRWEVATWNNLGLSHAYSGESSAALDCFESARDRAIALNDYRGLALAYEGLSSLAISGGDSVEALVHAEQALELGRRSGSRAVEARAFLLFGDALRLQGNSTEAEGHYRSACAILDSIGAALVTIAEAHVAWALIEQERFQEAVPMIRSQRLLFKAEKRDHFVATSECCLMVWAAVEKDWNAWWEHLIDAEQLLIETGFVDFTCARLVALAAARAGTAGRTSDACRAYALALSIWEKLGWAEKIAETKAQIEQLQ